ncbi:transcription factor RSL2-like [Hibiscus syriacus]|uniref:transcription factor RSL2-like n=1 Tax=Hibiscus syriacus TaxID=106335 RepID=UPI0019239C5D|nr:transcription factor RSL2-like [Hibiscus syriacus]
MESVAVFHDEDWDSFNRMFSNEDQLDFMQQILHQFSFPPKHDERLNFINPSTFCPNPEANMSIGGVTESLFFSSNALDSNFHYKSQESSQSSNSSSSFFVPQPNHETCFLGGSNHIVLTNDISLSLDVSMDIDGVYDKITDSFTPAFPNIAMEDTVNVIKDLSADCFPELDGRHPSDNVNELVLKRKLDVLELHDDGDKIITNSSHTRKKRTRVPKDAAKVWKNLQSNKNRKNNLNGNEESNIGSDGQSSSTFTSDDDNVSQDNTNGGVLATSYSKAAQALNLNGKKRASRGSATDPQSLYARKRREKINERLRILQNLVPNGTKLLHNEDPQNS